MGMDASIGGSNMPLSVGRWMDGWLPPAEKLKWQFPGDGGELEIVEILKSDGLSNEEKERVDERREMKESVPISVEGTSSAQVIVTGASQDSYAEYGDNEETEEEWQTEKAGVAGKLRGRSSARNKNRATRPPALEIHSTKTSSVTPIARPLPNLPPLMSPNTVSSPDSSRSQVPTVTASSRFASADTSLDAGALSPPLSRSLSPSPTAKVDKGGSKRFSWGWKSRDKKEKKGSKSKKGQKPQPFSSHSPTPESLPPVTYQMEAENNPLTSTREGTFDTMEGPGVDDKDDVVDELDERVKERVSRYVRWDPNVAWAKQAIWGNRESGGNANQQGNVRKMTGSTSSPTNPSIPGSTKSGSATSRGQRQVRDILVFGEVSHSLMFCSSC
jgi:hypothetical protein